MQVRVHGVLKANTENRVARVTSLLEFADDPLRLVDRDREPDADAARLRVGSALTLIERRDRGVDADDVAGHVDERPTGVAWVDRRVGLDRVEHRRSGTARTAGAVTTLRTHRTIQRAHDARRHGVGQPKR